MRDKQSDIIYNKNAITLAGLKAEIDNSIELIVDRSAVEEYKDVIVGKKKRYQHPFPDNNRQSPKMRNNTFYPSFSS